MNKIDDVLNNLSKSKFRSSFHLGENDIHYINDKSLSKIQEHAYDFIKRRLAPKIIENDGKQTPMRGHPVFIAQHATATCCRSCLYKWHHIPKNILLNEKEQMYILDVIMTWILREINR